MAANQRDTHPSESTKSKGDAPQHEGGDSISKAKAWGGGSKGSKGPVTADDKRNENSSAKS